MMRWWEDEMNWRANLHSGMHTLKYLVLRICDGGLGLWLTLEPWVYKFSIQESVVTCAGQSNRKASSRRSSVRWALVKRPEIWRCSTPMDGEASRQEKRDLICSTKGSETLGQWWLKGTGAEVWSRLKHWGYTRTYQVVGWNGKW